MFSVKVAGAVHHFYSPSSKFFKKTEMTVSEEEDVVFWSEAFRTITSQRYQDHEFIDDEVPRQDSFDRMGKASISTKSCPQGPHG